MFPIADLFFTDKKIAGIDLGSNSLKLVEIADSSGGYELKHWAEMPLERGIIENGLIKNQDILSKKIRELIKESKSLAKKAAIALSGHTVVVKKTSFRNMDDEELRQLITDEAGQFLPFEDSGDIEFDCHIIGDNLLNPEQMDVIVAAARKDVIKNYTHAIEKAGHKVAILDVDLFALQTAFERNYDLEANDVVALIHMGAGMTGINVVRGENSVFTRSIPMGGDTITEAIMRSKSIPFEEAEKIKCDVSAGTGDLREDVLEFAGPILGEIERTIDYFTIELGGMTVANVMLSGGCARIPGIVDRLSDVLRADVKIMNPFKNIKYDKKVFSDATIEKIGPVAVIGVGLALRRVDDL